MAQRSGQDDKGKACSLGCRAHGALGSRGPVWREVSPHRGEPEYRFYILLTKISTVQLSQALSASLWGTEESPTVELTAALRKEQDV